MRRFTLFDDPKIKRTLLPLTFTRPTSHIRVGIFTIEEKWKQYLDQEVAVYTNSILAMRYPFQAAKDNIFINGALCPNAALVAAITQLGPEEGIQSGDTVLAVRTAKSRPEEAENARWTEWNFSFTLIQRPWHIFQNNAKEIEADFKLLKHSSQKITDPHTIVYGADNLFVEEGVTTRAAIINAEKGPVYLGRNCIIQEGAVVAGTSAIGEGTSISMGAKIRGDSSFGPYCKIGGEIGNSVVFGYTNKAHEGYLGNSVVGEWCNLGADTNTSNLKNNYANVKVWDYALDGITDTGLTFCGLIMGDHSKCGINTMFNTGTVVGVSVNVFGSGYPNMFIPSFSWGGADGFSTYRLDRALEVASIVKMRRNIVLDDNEKAILSHIFESSSLYRIWDK